METYISHQYGTMLMDAKVTSSPYFQGMMKDDDRRKELERIRAAHPNPTDDEVRAAVERLQPVLNEPSLDSVTGDMLIGLGLSLLIGAGLLELMGAVSLVLAATCRLGPMLRILGIELVTSDGRPASRGRLFWRGLVAWSPVWLVPVVVAFVVPAIKLATMEELPPAVAQTLNEDQQVDAYIDRLDQHNRMLFTAIGVLSVSVGVVSMVWSLALPGRGLPDRIARTWPVPR